MTEIRPIRRDEADTFLRLLCGVFDLDFERARSVFYGEPYFDLTRKWALFESGEMVSVLTTTPLHFGWGEAVGIAGVATVRGARGDGKAARLIECVLESSTYELPAMLFAKDDRLYTKVGFTVSDHVVRGTVQVTDQYEDLAPMVLAQVQSLYGRWADASPNRLRRDAHRWDYWQWHYRVCAPYSDGYITSEPGVLREAVFWEKPTALPMPRGTDWFGTLKVADDLGLALENVERELLMMTRGFPGVPEMFMTDQF